MFRMRQYLVFFFVITLLFFMFIRLFYLQVIKFERFSELAAGQHNTVLKLEPRRGTIFDRYMEPMAINLDAPSVYCDSRSVKDKEFASSALSEVLDVDRAVILDRLSRDKAFVWLKRKVSPEVARKVKKLDISGIHFITESERNYASEDMASHIIGFVGIDNDGLEGLEMMFDEKLKGKPGLRHLVRDAKRRTVLFIERDSIPPQNGYNLVLTVDSVIQHITEEELKKTVKKFNAESASCVVMEPSTGKILALANYPAYNLNEFSEVPKDVIKNNAISSVFEPGSVFKVVTASAALNEGKVELGDKFDCEMGEYVVGGRILHDYHSYGTLSFVDVIAKSSNIGTVKVAQRLGEKKLYDYVQRFGFGQETGVDLPGELGGISRPPEVWSRSDITTIPIGQGIAVTPLQLASAISVIANGGYLMKPYIVERITTWDGEVQKEFEPVTRRKVLEEETCTKMKGILRKVVTDGTGKKASSKTFETCGKTGTAQMVSPEGGYYPDKYYATFIGFAPMDAPKVSIIVTVRDPHPIHFGGSVAAPAFREIAERALQYLGTN